MLRVICAGAIGVAMFMGQPLFAQGPPGKDNIKKIQSELEVIKLLIKDIEARLENVKWESARRPGFGKGPPGGFGPSPFGKGKGPGGKGKGPWPKPGEFGKGPPGPGGFGMGPWGGAWGPWAKPGEFGKGPPGAGGFGKGPWGGAWGPWPGPKGPKGDGKKPGGSPRSQGDERSPGSRTLDIERRLDQIMREIQDLRRQIQKK